MSSQTKLRDELAKHVEEIAALKARAFTIRCENTDLKLQLEEVKEALKDTQAALGETIVLAKRKEEAMSVGPSKHFTTSLKRVWSPSLELDSASDNAKGKGMAKLQETITAPSSMKTRNRDLPYVSVPPMKAVVSVKTDKISPRKSPKLKFETPKKATGNDVKRRKVEHIIENIGTSSEADDSSGDEIIGGSNPMATSQPTGSTLSSSTIKPTPRSTTVRLRKKKEPKAKPPIFSLEPSMAKQYLKSAPTLPIAPPPLKLEVSRHKFLYIAYDGNPQHFFQYTPPELNPSGPVQRRLIFPTLDMSPSLPSSPGEPGLMFSSRHEILSNPSWSLFVKRNPKKAVWLYFGEYACVLCGKITADLFRNQKATVKEAWAKFLLKSKRDVYLLMRARIALRKAKVISFLVREEGTNSEKAEEKSYSKIEQEHIEEEMKSMKSGKGGHQVNQTDIIEAFSNGDEGIDIVLMTCVAYDHIFANDMKSKLANMDPVIAAHKQRKTKGVNAKAKPGVKKGGDPRSLAKTENKSFQGRSQAIIVSSESELTDLDEDADTATNLNDNRPTNNDSDPIGTPSTLALRPVRSSRKNAALGVVDTYDDEDDEDYMGQ